MEYYIQGNTQKASQIKIAFKAKGIDVLDFKFADKTLIYFSIGGCVQVVAYTVNLMHILHSHPNFQELPLPTKKTLKVGDLVVWFNSLLGRITEIDDDSAWIGNVKIPLDNVHKADHRDVIRITTR